MFAVVQLGSLQYRVAEGDVIDAQRFDVKKGETIALEKILFVSNGSNAHIGRPYLKNATVTAEILGEHLGEKQISYKYRRRKASAWKKGHRQKLVSLRISKINVG